MKIIKWHTALLAVWSLSSAAQAQFPQAGLGQFAQGASLSQFPQGASLSQYPQGVSVSGFPQGVALGPYSQATSIGQFAQSPVQGHAQFPQYPQGAQYAQGAALAQFPKGASLAQFPKRTLIGRPRPRWPAGPPKQHFLYAKGPPQFYRGQKPLLKMPNVYPGGMFKTPLTYRPTAMKDAVFRNPQPQTPLISNPSHQLQADGSLSHSPFTSQSPVHNLLAGQPSSHKILSQSNQPYTFITPQTSPQTYASPQPQPAKSQVVHLPQPQALKSQAPINIQSSSLSLNTQSPVQVIPYASLHLAGPAGRPHSYPIRIDGEGGPIHTIPAPNLSLADKPIVVPEYSNHIDTQPSYYQKVRGGNTYEVTEDTNDKAPGADFQEQYSSQQKFYTSVDPIISSSKLTASRNPFSSVTKHAHALPQAHALQAQLVPFEPQSVAPSLTSQELFRLLGGSHSQQQLADSYPLPLLQQPQLQQHFLQQTLDSESSLQPFNAIVQQSHVGASKPQQSVLFKPDPKYIQKIQDQFLKQSAFQPNYQTFNYVEPSRAESIAQSEALKADADDTSDESSKLHYNVVRNTKEGVPQEKTFPATGNKNQTNVIEDSDTGDSYNIETKVRFLPTALPDIEGKGFSNTNPMENTYFSQLGNSGSSSISSSYLASMSNSDIADTLAALQAADNLIKLTKNANDAKSTQSKYAINLGPYFIQNTLPNNDKPEFISQSNNAFTPIKGTPFSLNDDIVQPYSNQPPIRIFVPDQYDDIETQPSDNIQVSASLNTNENIKSEIKSFENYEDSDTSNTQQDYDDYSQIPESEIKQSVNPHSTEDRKTESTSEVKGNSNDVLVTVQKNVTNPTLDILTKDWKTSIVIKPKSTGSRSDVVSDINQVAEFGNRIRPKREE